jgi:hypothetical protein
MHCRACKKKNLKKIIDFGNFPVCHKFKNKNQKEQKHSLQIGICKNCKLVQLSNLFPLKQLKPKYKWINYNEPEEHLDSLVKKISKLKNINKKSIIAGVSYKEISTLKRFKSIGFVKNWILDMKKDLNIQDNSSNLETIQEKISRMDIKKILKKKKKADVLIARHILEHTYDTINFINSLKNLINNDGYLIFEVPDCKESFISSDYTSIWEEHILYFTENTLKKLLINQGLKIIYFEKYKYSYENVLIVIAKIDKDHYLRKKKKETLPKINFNSIYLAKDKIKIRNKIKKFRSESYKICLFGTGHAACTFLNILKLHDLIDLVVDDDRNKTNLFLPNSNLQIEESSNLKKFDKVLLILGVNSESEKKIITKSKKINSKIKFFSIYNKSRFSFK